MLLHGAEQLGLSHRQYLEIVEAVEDTLDFLTSTLTYLIHAEKQQPEPNLVLIAKWDALKQEVLDLEHSLPGSNVTAYQQAIQTYRQHFLDLRPIVDRYRDN